MSTSAASNNTKRKWEEEDTGDKNKKRQKQNEFWVEEYARTNDACFIKTQAKIKLQAKNNMDNLNTFMEFLDKYNKRHTIAEKDPQAAEFVIAVHFESEYLNEMQQLTRKFMPQVN
jgi:outer membrane phospholipase A